MTKKLKRYCCSWDTSQDFGLRLEEISKDDDWCLGFRFEDDGTLIKKWNEAQDKLYIVMQKIRDKAESQAIEEIYTGKATQLETTSTFYTSISDEEPR